MSDSKKFTIRVHYEVIEDYTVFASDGDTAVEIYEDGGSTVDSRIVETLHHQIVDVKEVT